MLIKKIGMVLVAVLLSGVALAAELIAEQQAAKEKGITLYNQYKAISAEPYLEKAAKAGDREAQLLRRGIAIE
ncbi:hypothetical protein [Phytopseudomonas seleniipraecipitans]|uniref:hypothetical protein n=1 Tax=Phytopseudomonas seleniipraecipitans TaxID=640205 RepID=UPI001F13338B|nr:hypothetical protein [Pseudomonas seleniipraecipitans]